MCEDAKRVTNLGDGELITYIDEYPAQVVVDDTLSITAGSDGEIDVSSSMYLNWTLSKMDMCIFIKILIDKFDLPIVVIDGEENETKL